MEVKELVERVSQDKELGRKVEQAVLSGADARQVVDVLAEAGVEADAATVEGYLAEVHERLGEEIFNQDLDLEALESVAGGTKVRSDHLVRDGEHLGGCEGFDWYEQECDATVEEGSDCWGTDSCTMYSSYYTQRMMAD